MILLFGWIRVDGVNGQAAPVIHTIHSNLDILVEREGFLMSSLESAQIRSYLLARQTAHQDAPQPSLVEQRADYESLIENYIGHPVPLPEGTRKERNVYEH